MEGAFITFIHSQKDGVGYTLGLSSGTVKAVYTDTMDLERKTTPITMLIVELENGTFVHVPAKNIHEIRLPEYFETVEQEESIKFLKKKLEVEKLLLDRTFFAEKMIHLDFEGVENEHMYKDFIRCLALEIVGCMDKIV